MSNLNVVSLGAALHAAAKFRQLFSKSYVRWETCGWIRRQVREGPLELVHVAIPKAAPAQSEFGNALWDRSKHLLITKAIAAAQLASGALSLPEPETILLEFTLGGARHRLIRTHELAWGARLVEHTGPANYWRMLLWRMQLAGTLKMHKGQPCIVDRAGTAEQLVPIPCVDERTFFMLARTRFKDPKYRFAFPDDVRTPEWSRGMTPEWYPAGSKVYVSPNQPGLFDRSKTVDPRYVGRDPQKWMRS